MNFDLVLKTLDGSLDERIPLVKQAYVLGREATCDIRLNRPTISKRHAELQRRGASYLIRDLNSSSGVFVNDNRVAHTELKPGDRLILGDVLVWYEASAAPSGGAATELIRAGNSQAGSTVAMTAEELRQAQMSGGLPTASGGPGGAVATGFIPAQKQQEDASPFASANQKNKIEHRSDVYTQLRASIHEELIEAIRIRKNSLETLEDQELWNKARTFTNQIIFGLQQTQRLPAGIDPQQLLRDVLNEALGLGPIQDFLGDPEIEEIMVNGPYNIYYVRKGQMLKSDKVYIDEERLETVINRIVAPLGRQINKLSPMVDARLSDGSRVNAIIAPVSRIGPVLTIRKFPAKPLSPEELVKRGAMSPAMMKFFKLAVEHRLNIVVSGATAAGKTTLLNCLSSFIPADERIITIEDSAELQIPLPHVITLETRPGNAEGTPEITIRDLVRNALRMRPNRVIVGECRGGEAVDMLQAMNTGHDGSLTTGHSNGPREMLSRLETMCLMAGIDMPLVAIREQVARAINLVIQVERFPDGKRRITYVTELAGLDEGEYMLKDIYRFETQTFSDEKVEGRFVPCGLIPNFIARLKDMGVDVPLDIFSAD